MIQWCNHKIKNNSLGIRVSKILQKVLSYLYCLSTILLVIANMGCTVNPDDISSATSIEEIMTLAERAKNRGSFKEAGDFYMEVDRIYPYSDAARKALIKAMTVYHEGTDLYNARISAKRYLALYPDGPDAAFAQYMIGLSFFDAIVDVRRDQGSALDAVEAFKLLNLKYPKNPYKDLAAQKLKIAYSQLAGQEMSVGRYYMKREEYLAAINRFSIVVNEYSDSIFLVEAYYRLTEAYLALGLNNLAKENNSLFTKQFPKSDWASRSNQLVRRLKL